MLVLVAVGAAPLVAKPRVTWTPTEVTATVIHEEPQQTTVSFSSSEDLGLVVLRVVPELEPYVSVSPDTAFEVLTNQDYTVTLSFDLVGYDVLGLLAGTLQVWAVDENSHFSKPLPVRLDLLPFELPADPGDIGKDTLQGVDSDSDGVRDDVQRFIAFRHPTDPEARSALRQYAKVMQANLLRTGNSEDARAGVPHIHRAHDCLYYTFGEWENGIQVEFESPNQERLATKAELLNTRERIEAFLEYDSLLSGGLYFTDEATAEDCVEEVAQ